MRLSYPLIFYVLFFCFWGLRAAAQEQRIVTPYSRLDTYNVSAFRFFGGGDVKYLTPKSGDFTIQVTGWHVGLEKQYPKFSIGGTYYRGKAQYMGRDEKPLELGLVKKQDTVRSLAEGYQTNFTASQWEGHFMAQLVRTKRFQVHLGGLFGKFILEPEKSDCTFLEDKYSLSGFYGAPFLYIDLGISIRWTLYASAAYEISMDAKSVHACAGLKCMLF